MTLKFKLEKWGTMWLRLNWLGIEQLPINMNAVMGCGIS
jgi:hypothetical protein